MLFRSPAAADEIERLRAETDKLRASLAASDERRELLANVLVAVKMLLKKGRAAEALETIGDLDRELEAQYAAYRAAEPQP